MTDEPKTYARLKRRWLGKTPIPMLLGGWYPVVSEDRHGAVMNANGTKVDLFKNELELSQRPRRHAVFALSADGQRVIAVCPEGHHIENPSVTKPRARCEQCQREYEIET